MRRTEALLSELARGDSVIQGASLVYLNRRPQCSQLGHINDLNRTILGHSSAEMTKQILTISTLRDFLRLDPAGSAPTFARFTNLWPSLSLSLQLLAPL